MYQIWYYIPNKRYDYIEKETWKEVVDFLSASEKNINEGMIYEIKRWDT